jgi:hypothetical protein
MELTDDMIAVLLKARTDARRYQWLRLQCGNLHVCKGPAWDQKHYYGDELDDTIDEEMKTAKQKEKTAS